VTDSPQIPDQWLSLLIGEIVDVVAGGTPKASDPANFAEPGTQIAWLTPADLSKYSKKYITHGARDLSKTGYEGSSAKLMPAGTLLFSSRAPIGYVAVAANEISTNQGFKNFVLPAEIDPSYAYYFLRSIRDVAESMGTGTTFKEISGANAKKLPFILPPLAEQKVIADKLDTLLAQVENTKAHLERIPQILKRFRQSVLAAAVSGGLTEEWRPNSGSFVHALAEDWKWAPVPDTWEVKLYPDLVESRLGKMLDKAKNSGLSTKYLGNINVRWFNFNLSDVQEILVSETERNELSIRPGDVLICEGGEPGRCAIWDGRVEEQIVFQKALHRARVSDALLPEWLALNLKHDADSLTLEQLFTGTTIKHLTGKALKKYPLRVPPINEQTEIVRRVDQLFAHADRIEQQVNNALARVNNLTQSILAKAFRGELTEQWRKDNPELISGENSAEALLERIKAERATQKPASRRTKARKTETVSK